MAACVAEEISTTEGDSFILTGSYSIDLLTNADVTHNDVDANIFTGNIRESVGRVALILESYEKLTKILHTDKRLEYQYTDGERSSEIELQFVQYADAVECSDGVDFILPSRDADREVIVPTVFRRTSIGAADGETYQFQVKTLEFAIATWALRISGVALSQKRKVRQTDIDHFAHLLNTEHTTDGVIFSIEHHPQMPQLTEPTHVLSRAKSLIYGNSL
jgi:hypothetical protein